VQVPYVPNAWPVAGKAGRRNFSGSVGWYRTTVTVPQGGVYAIRFESVNHRAAVWLDGKLIGEHKGVYMPFELRPTLAAGHKYLLVVRADWRNPVPVMKREGWHRGWFNYGGINREVTIRRLQASEIEAPFVHTRLASGVAHVALRVRVQNRGRTRTIAPQGTLRPPRRGAARRAVPRADRAGPEAAPCSPRLSMCPPLRRGRRGLRPFTTFASSCRARAAGRAASGCGS